MNQTTNILLGPPGTGKTTRLLDIMETELTNGVEPNRMVFCSFTKKAIGEATDRACDRFGFSKNDMTYFRTIHSLAFMSLGLKKNQVMQPNDYKKLGEHLGITFSVKSEFYVEGPHATSKHVGDQYAFIDGFSRARHISVRTVWDMIDHEKLNWFEFRRYQNTLAAYRKSRGLYDFSAMLEMSMVELDVDVVIIDEAQDLSTAQWYFITKTFKKAKRVYIGGDDDQAIFEWSGADVNKFITIDGQRTILTQSYRVPKSVHNLANNVSAKIKSRTEKDYHPRADEGLVEYWPAVDAIDMSSGTWLLLSRNSYLLSELTAAVRSKGLNYLYRGKSSVVGSDVKAIQIWTRYCQGYELTDKDIDLLNEYVTGYENKCIWHEAFKRMPLETREYYVSLLRRGESLTKNPRISISTIHGAKGGEADNVVLLTDMSYSTWEGSSWNSDSEHRVWYVGATRAKNALHIVMPRGRYYYDL